MNSLNCAASIEQFMVGNMRAYWWYFGIILLFAIEPASMRFEFTNIDCAVIDDTFTHIPYCYLKSVNRTYKYLSLNVGLFEKPITNITTQIALFKRANGYKPFLYNITFDVCKFLGATRREPLQNLFYSFFSQNTNLNHSCPFNHDILVDKLDARSIANIVTKTLPFPTGDYHFHSSWRVYGKERLQINVYGRVIN